jgi:hypothetical protein
MSETIELKLAIGRLQTVKPCDICGECTDKEVSNCNLQAAMTLLLRDSKNGWMLMAVMTKYLKP